MLEKGLLRLVDANLNRLREGIRVVEDVCRYVFNNQKLSSTLKELRHQARSKLYDACLQSRDSERDVLKKTVELENIRANGKSVLIANLKRAQESARVLEETLKLENADEAEKFKQLRYRLYTLEKEIMEAVERYVWSQ